MASSRNSRSGARISTTKGDLQNFPIFRAPVTEVLLPSQAKQEGLAEWVEPPLRPPAPSYEDHRGLEGLGVLEYMAPLGTMPSTKVKQRLKVYDPPRKGPPKGNFVRVRQDTSTPEPSTLVFNRRPDPQHSEDRQARAQSSRIKDEDMDYTPQNTIRISAPRPSQRTTAPSTPGSARSPTTPASIKKVVDAGIQHAQQSGNMYLGLALQRLYADSLYDPKMADLLQSVLARRQTESERAEFQQYIKVTKKEAKEEQKRKKRLQNGKESPFVIIACDNFRWWRLDTLYSQIRVHNKVSGCDTPHRPFSALLFPHLSSIIDYADIMKGHEISLKGDRPRKKMKRSESASTLSTVRSSLSPPPHGSGPSRERSIPSSNNSLNSTVKPRGPRLHLFQPRGSKSSSSSSNHKRANGFVASSPALRPELTADATELKRRQFRKENDFKIEESSVRRSPTAQREPYLPFTGTSRVPASRQQQTQLRNGTVRRNVNDESDDGLSPPPEVLRPPEGIERRVTRGGTPSQSYRIVKKGGARIKTS